jgi:hypothetical protein
VGGGDVTFLCSFFRCGRCVTFFGFGRTCGRTCVDGVITAGVDGDWLTDGVCVCRDGRGAGCGADFFGVGFLAGGGGTGVGAGTGAGTVCVGTVVVTGGSSARAGPAMSPKIPVTTRTTSGARMRQPQNECLAGNPLVLPWTTPIKRRF